MVIYGYTQRRRLLVNMKRFTTLVSVWTGMKTPIRTVPLLMIVLLLDLYARIIGSWYVTQSPWGWCCEPTSTFIRMA
jgi:hypothetical protein